MANRCITPDLDTTQYSSPVPVIGLYIAAGSSVCLLFMLFDIISAYRRSQSWIPCRLFKLNSLTLTLMSIATKLQVDLTTAMPSVPDQLLKLTGTTLLCICMGFSNPSVGNDKGSDFFSNMAALSIMIITIVVNICIQFKTGVIHLFIVEHIIIMCCIFVVVFLMWHCAYMTKHRNKEDIWVVTLLMAEDSSKSLLERLNECYARSFNREPQQKACLDVHNLSLLVFCFVCFCVLAQATVRSVVFKQLQSCGGGSDYDWSTWFILISQVLTIIVGCIAICFRWFASFQAVENDVDLKEYLEDNEPMVPGSWYKFGIYLQTCSYYVAEFFVCLVMFSLLILFEFVRSKVFKLEEYPLNRTREKAMTDIDKCVQESQRGSPKEMLNLFSRRSPSPQFHKLNKDIRVSPLSLAALVKTAITCLPEALTETLVHCFHEAIDIFQPFIDPKHPHHEMFMMNPLLVDKAFDTNVSIALSFGISTDLSPLDYARKILDKLLMGERYIDVIKVITSQDYNTVEELYSIIEQLFVDMLFYLFRHLPKSIFITATESPMDVYKERVRCALVSLLKIAPLDGRVEWSFPEKSHITSLLLPPPHEDVSSSSTHHVVTVETEAEL